MLQSNEIHKKGRDHFNKLGYTTVPHNHSYISSYKPQLAVYFSYLFRDGYVERWYPSLL